jgi:hypothetical protein
MAQRTKAALVADNERLTRELTVCRDRLAMAERRVRVLTGSDVLTHVSSRGVVQWLRAINEATDMINGTAHARLQLNALIETLEAPKSTDPTP